MTTNQNDGVFAGALHGYTVVDFSQGIAGPHCAAMLAELGADVIKVEPPQGDWSRGMGEKVGDSTSMYETFNRGKRSHIIDLKTQGGLREALDLARGADIVIESARVGAMQRLGLGFDAIKQINDRVIYVSISGFGQHGPLATEPATDTVMQAYTGLALGASAVEAPTRVRVAIVDIVTGIYASNATLAAVLKRQQLPQAQHLDISLMHAMAAMQNYKIVDEVVHGMRRLDEAMPITGIYRSQDGDFSLSLANEKQMVAALAAFGCESMLQKPDFATRELRKQNQQAMRDGLAAIIARHSCDDCLQLLRQAGVPAQRILNYPAFLNDAQMQAMGVVNQVQARNGYEIVAIRSPGLPELPLRRAPGLGEAMAATTA